jgi:ABC-2 type transport system permease protein
MNTPSNVMAESQSRPEATATVEISPARRLCWSVQRELWENRSIYIAPLAVGAVFLAGFFISLFHLPNRMRGVMALSPMQQHEAIQQPYVIVALMLMATDLLVAAFYCLDALYGERRDRSILFWKSLPVSDLTTVLSKASIPILVLPLITVAITVATQLIMLLVSSAVLTGNGQALGLLWSHVALFKMTLINFFHLVVFHGIWWAPFYGWLLLVSAWARRAPFLWATLPPAAIAVVERVAFSTSHFAELLQYRFSGVPQTGDAQAGMMTMDMLAPDSMGQFLISPGLWIGLAVTAAFLFAAVRLRRSRGPI